MTSNLGLCLVWLVAIGASPPPSTPNGGRAGAIALGDERGISPRLADWEAGRPLVIVFLASGCPLTELYAGTLAELAAGFGPRGVAFLGLAPNRRDTPEAIARFAKVHHLSFPIHADREGGVAARLGVTRTPAVVVLDAARTIRYRGRIDDQYRRDAHRTEPLSRDLEGALKALLSGRSIDVPETEAIGCPIERPATGPPAATPGDVAYTFGRDVAPILRRRCVVCHSTGQIAPFALTTYRQASGWAESIAEAVEDRRMPPWHADPAHGTFENAARLSDIEIRVLTEWARGGCPRGEPIEPITPAVAAGGWSIPGPDLVVAIPRPFEVPAEGILDYQQFEVDPGFREDRWVTAAEILPGNRRVVHHCTVFLEPPGASEPGFTPGALGSFCLAATAPGTSAMVLPPGMAKRIPAGWRLLFVIHYTATGTPQIDRTRLGLNFSPASAVRNEVATRLLYDADLSIPPHASDHRVERSWKTESDLLLLALFPHMHLRGKSFRYEAGYPDGTSETLLFVPRYDFNWQHRYVLATPRRIPAGTTLRCIAYYDNSAANPANPNPSATVHTGKQSSDEMFNGYFDVALADQNAARLATALPTAFAQWARLRPAAALAASVTLAGCAIALWLARLTD